MLSIIQSANDVMFEGKKVCINQFVVKSNYTLEADKVVFLGLWLTCMMIAYCLHDSCKLVWVVIIYHESNLNSKTWLHLFQKVVRSDLA